MGNQCEACTNTEQEKFTTLEINPTLDYNLQP